MHTYTHHDGRWFKDSQPMSPTELQLLIAELQLALSLETKPQKKSSSSKKATSDVEFFVDAGTKNNGQYGSQQTVIAGMDSDREIIFEDQIGDATNNNGEIRAIIKILEHVQSHNLQHAVINSDSQIAVNWTKKGVTTNSPTNQPYVAQAHQLLKATGATLQWIPREKNIAGQYLEAQLKASRL
jgi:ribonuclease HI